MALMKHEGGDFDKKSLRSITGRSADWDDIARACIAFANAKGGCLRVVLKTIPTSHRSANRWMTDWLISCGEGFENSQ